MIFVSSVVLSMSIKSTAGNKQRKVSFEELNLTISLIVTDPLKNCEQKILTVRVDSRMSFRSVSRSSKDTSGKPSERISMARLS